MPVGDLGYMRAVLRAPGLPRGLEYVGGDLVKDLVRRLARSDGTRGDGTRSDGASRVRFVRFDLARQLLWPADL
eukprot:1437561-Prymnesium_polylepis.1